MAAGVYVTGPSTKSGFNLNPTPTGGTDAYGKVPGQIGKPPSIYEGVQSIYPGLGTSVANAADVINAQLNGEFSPETEAALWDTANKFGVASGMPTSKMWGNKFMGNVAGYKESLQNQGLSNLNQSMSTLGAMVDNPALLAQIAQSNAILAAAPDPRAAANLAKSLAKAGLDAGSKAGFMGPMTTPSGGSYQAPSGGYPSIGGGGYLNGSIYSMNPIAGPQSETPFTTQDWLNSIGYTGNPSGGTGEGFIYMGEDDPYGNLQDFYNDGYYFDPALEGY